MISYNDKDENNLGKNEKMIGEKKDENKSSQEIFDKKEKTSDSSLINNSRNETTKTINNSLVNKSTSNKIDKQKSPVKSNITISSSQVFTNSNDTGKNLQNNLSDITVDGSKNVKDSSTTKKVITKISDNDSSVTADDNNNNPKKEDEDNRDKFSVELYTSPVFPINSIHADNSNYEQVLKDAGKMQLSYSFGARLDVKITKKISGKIGVQYTQINEKINFRMIVFCTENTISKQSL